MNAGKLTASGFQQTWRFRDVPTDVSWIFVKPVYWNFATKRQIVNLTEPYDGDKNHVIRGLFS